MHWWAFEIDSVSNISPVAQTAADAQNCHAYLAIDILASYPMQAEKTAGSAACRTLLAKLQAKIGLQGKLSDDSLPYRLVHTKQSDITPDYFVSFSHSRKQIAVLIAPFAKLAVDIEDQPVSTAVARRFFHAAENSWLATLAKAQQAPARQLLWCLKECLLKQRQACDSRLFDAVGKNVLIDITPKHLGVLLAHTAGQGVNCLYQTTPSTRFIAYLPTCQCAVIICRDSCNNFAKKTQNFFVL